jgi:hypothetical protein
VTYLLVCGIPTTLSPRGMFLARGTVPAGNSHQTRASQAGIRSQKVTRNRCCVEGAGAEKLDQNHMINLNFCPGPRLVLTRFLVPDVNECKISQSNRCKINVPLPMLVRQEKRRLIQQGKNTVALAPTGSSQFHPSW